MAANSHLYNANQVSQLPGLGGPQIGNGVPIGQQQQFQMPHNEPDYNHQQMQSTPSGGGGSDFMNRLGQMAAGGAGGGGNIQPMMPEPFNQ